MMDQQPAAGTRFFAWLCFLGCAAALLLWVLQRSESHANPQAHLLTLEMIRNKPEERLRAIGETDELPVPLKSAFDPDKDFEVLSQPQPGDWLWQYAEPGQTYPAFLASGANVPDSTRNVIYLQPMGPFPEVGSPSLDQLQVFTAAYFSMEVRVQPAIEFDGAGLTFRANPHSGQQQYLTGDILNLLITKLPDDAYCMLAVTMVDLFPESSWNFVFGQASLQARVGVFSFARYDPLFYGGERDKTYETTLLRRSCKLLAHEAGHMFGIRHCIWFNCLMNGINHLRESEEKPIHLCPVDLRKLQHSVGFDVFHRYRSLARFYRSAGLLKEARWVEGRLQRID